ncbi:GAF domain-containing protein [Dyadobacter subterraneus]|uniref:GAF domain-containing protein n=1 Tax=Dyadobacter subterraneus TaxID=2773304 RepID=A0ABR9W954_9BACT|nr:GAF domain-containing protein [Dyadobacter subterraneus]MBE9461998.1 GAF domain-containing protein [Dyadobacter subterraneus]
MKAIILDLTKASGTDINVLSSSVSFRKFIGFVQEAVRAEHGPRLTFLENALEILTSQKGFSEVETIEQASEYLDQLDVVFQLLSPNLEQEESIFWAIGQPLSPVMFYGTDRFYQMVLDPETEELRSEMITKDSAGLSEYDKVLPMYALILERLYGIYTQAYRPLIISITEYKTRLPQYFRINIDHRFTDVFAAGTLPEINEQTVKELLVGNGDFRQLFKLLPVNQFRFEGISIITLTDVTLEYALEQIKDISIKMDKVDQVDTLYYETFFRHLTDSLRTIGANPGLEFGFIPQLRVNNKLTVDRKTIFHSKLVSVDLPEDYLTDIYLLFATHFEQYPEAIFSTGSPTDEQLTRFVDAIKSAGIHFYSMQPVYNGLEVVGLFEIYSTQELVPDEKALSQINLAKPLISKFFQNAIDHFNKNIETVIQEKFTSIQQSVQWKFREAAWHFIRDNSQERPAAIGKIVFKNVYPVYGAVDIRDSTLLRNDSLRKDLKFQFASIVDLLKTISQEINLLLGQEMAYKCQNILSEITNESGKLDEMKVAEFLEADLHPFLHHFLLGSEEKSKTKDNISPKQRHVSLSIQRYFETIDPDTGTAFANRRDLEESMNMINSTINDALDQFQTQVQPLYPVYFEKFRTDGVEYDIYTGQSIDPDKKFSSVYLKNIRIWQISSMASIIKLTRELLPFMPVQLHTTQLIFVNSGTIDISFRDDERRFDVEGAYNIRYQVIKKRIDKVHISGTGERLTQPGKIALVYFQENSVRDHLDYIRFLQAQNILAEDLEFLVLEELQGVSGLKALRVGVNPANRQN